ncbi:hypothetical protein N7468_004239 [Penicillium chermesinum]|uniref:3-keto-alpha-glucoside-1,2-lyase/3-keto-2-hydroxy-glucal hydratase domain-containing protein n=1 Tax=Penicillium chermesinum TaxID=63820 RepID=A0A9W9TSD2_9EURO|nr:uncharacterized protein N7468_004239 [Penicillium chermesinum]KAJ5239620.1 hypothetical protein N7468_004239 [Penicillium chermesinum]KAJ6166511.1 hypothetical protein N7470_001958 [Penicillium chermesinum]
MVKFHSLAAYYALASVLTNPLTTADSTGNYLWKRAEDNEANTYARVIQLQHAGHQNGKLLATWEHVYTESATNATPNGTVGSFIIRESNSNGLDWTTLSTVNGSQTNPSDPDTTFWQPFFFEFPRQLGKYPAGTLLLVGNISPAELNTTFYTWRSSDHGRTWDLVGPWQTGIQTANGYRGIWEPFLYLDPEDNLVAVFSDERDPDHSQMLVQVTSSDGGDNWSNVTWAVASPDPSERPGMASVARMDNGEYIMAYEFCQFPDGHDICKVHTKTSSDGVTWNAGDMGVNVTTEDGLFAAASPNIIWDERQKQLLLASHFTWDVANMQSGKGYPEGAYPPMNNRIVYVNTNLGEGDWAWAPAPWSISNISTNSPVQTCAYGYSPYLNAQADGSIRLTAPSSQDASGPCSERTGAVSSIGALPYTADFTAEGQAGWIDLTGNWSVAGKEYGFENADTQPSLAITGSSEWSDYEISSAVQVVGDDGAAGVYARVTASTTGINWINGYRAEISARTGKLSIALQTDTVTTLAEQEYPWGITQGYWYHLSLLVKGDRIVARVSGFLGLDFIVESRDSSLSHGMGGLYGYDGSATFRDVEIRD